MHAKSVLKPISGSIVAAILTLSFSSVAYGAGKHGGGHGHGGGIGEVGMASHATRTVEIVMTDNRFAPVRLSVRKGETIRFVIRNKGEFVHEFDIGTAKILHFTDAGWRCDVDFCEIVTPT